MKTDLDPALARFASRWRWGLVLAALARTAAIALLGLLGLGGCDLLAPFSDPVRPLVFTGWCTFVAVAGLAALVPVLRFGNREAAAGADAGSPARRPVTTAWEVTRQQVEMTPMRQFLTEQVVRDGIRALGSLAFPANLPWRSMKRALAGVSAVFAVLAVLSMANFGAVRVIAVRLLRPEADVPPYSPLRFEVTPTHPKVLYGSDAELEVAVTGGRVPEGVVLLTREDRSGPVTETGAYAMGGGRYGQRLQRVTQPVQVAFAAGRARSPWITVDLMRQPRLESVSFRVVPPAYAKRPVREFALGTSELVALAGSEVEVRILSNRPLGGGEAVLTPPRSLSREKAETVVVRADGNREVVLRWKVKWPCLVRLDVTDITGGRSSSPVEVEQKLLADQPPLVSLESPAGVTLATPESEVPLEVSVEDDLGIARVDLVRRLAGFRDRGKRLAEDAGDRVFSVGEKLSLKELGVEPGQTLEFHAEAHDHNPSLLGIGSSGVGRIQVISTEDYAALVRARTTLEEFRSRFAVLDAAVTDVREALASGDARAAKEAMRRAREMAEALGRDFRAFDAEEQVAREAERIAKLLEGMEARLAADPSRPTMDRLREELGTAGEPAARLRETGERLAAIGRVLEMAAEFKAMHALQADLTRQLEELARQIQLGDMRQAAKLDGLSRRQQAVLDRWKEWLPELRAAAEALPAGEEDLRREALAFGDAAERSGIQRHLESALERARKDSTPDTFVNAQLALEAMERLLDSPNALCQAARDGSIRFPTGEGLAGTLAQMLAGMCQRRMPGPGSKPAEVPGSGGGPGGDGDGYSTEGDPLLNAPLYGPERLAFSGDDTLRGRHGSRRGGSGDGKPAVTADSASAVGAVPTRSTAKRQISLRDVPERYRDAVRRFYGEDVVLETTSPTGTP
jgi:hypothetical protein